MNKERSLQVQEAAQIKQQQREYDGAFNQYVQQTAAAAMAREAEFQARRREQVREIGMAWQLGQSAPGAAGCGQARNLCGGRPGPVTVS
jgi:hypothetical protein